MIIHFLKAKVSNPLIMADVICTSKEKSLHEKLLSISQTTLFFNLGLRIWEFHIFCCQPKSFIFGCWLALLGLS